MDVQDRAEARIGLGGQLRTAVKDTATQMRLIAALAVATLLLLYVTAGLLNLWGYRDVIENAERQLSTLDYLLSEETARTVDGVKLAVDTIAQDLIDEHVEKAASGQEMLGASMRRALRRTVALLPQMSDIAVRLQDGRMEMAGRATEASVERVVIASMDVVDGVAYVGAQDEGDVHGSSLAVVRHAVAPDGQLVGVIVGILPVSYFQSLYRSLDIGQGGAVSLWWRDGTLIVREPLFGQVGRRYEAMEMRFPEDARILTYTSDDEDMPGDRMMSVKGVRGYPLAVAASYSMAIVLTPWWRTMLYSFAGSIFLTLLAGLLVAAVGRQFENAETIRRVANQHQKAMDERERIAEQLRQSQKLEVVGQLTAGIAHDFNNLLTVVIGNLEVLGRRLAKMPEDAVAKRSVDSAMSGAKKAATLTHRLLAFARKQPLAPASIDVPVMVANLADLLRRTLGEAVEVVVEADDGAWPVYVDASQLENALMNLAVNSRDAMPEGGRVGISMRNVYVDRDASNLTPGLVGEFLAISVSDTGHGMTAETASRAFEPFFSTKEVGKGSGLGLSQIYGFAKQSGGDCTIESAVGRGTTVTIYLPRSDVPAEEDAGDMENHVVRGKGETILVVDDSPQVRDYAVRALRELGYLVRQANDANEALGIVARGGIDCLLTDIGLPGMDGVELAQAVRSKRPDIAIVLMTAYTDRFATLRDDLKRDCALLPKPFRYGEVSRAVSKAIMGESA